MQFLTDLKKKILVWAVGVNQKFWKPIKKVKKYDLEK